MSNSEEREDFICVNGPLDREVISLPYGSTSTVTFSHKGRRGRYTMLPAELTGKDGVTPCTPTTAELYWEPTRNEYVNGTLKRVKKGGSGRQSKSPLQH